jgi:predicted ArsR family transcriptional regulator
MIVWLITVKDGRYTQYVSDEDILYFFETSEQPIHSAGDIAEQFGLSRQQAHRRLGKLEKRNELRCIELGQRNTAWWKPRDIVVLMQEEDGYSAHDLTVDVASEGETRSKALRKLAEAIEVSEGDSEMTAEAEIYAELGIDPDETDESSPPQF